MTYLCSYSIGAMRDGLPIQHDGGIWEVRETPKMVTFRQVIPPFFSTPWKELKCRKDNEARHHLTIHDDGTYTVYPDRQGIPYFFTPKVESKPTN